MPPDLVALPKVELHVHLEGTITAGTAIDLAQRHGEDPGELFFGGYPQRFEDFLGFLDLYLAVSRQVRSPDDLYTVAKAFAEDRAHQNIVYTEVTFTALTHVRSGMEPAAMWEAVSAGLREVPAGSFIGIIVDSVRDMGTEHMEETLRLVEEADAPIVGLGLTGIEGSAPEREFKMLRDAADRLGLGLAVHAGETGTAENVRSALDDLGADRIGHGVASWRDRSLVERLVADGTPIEVCPSSNVSLQIFPSLDEHPFPDMWRAGMNVTINSDDPPFFSTTLTRELELMRAAAGLGTEDMAELQRRGAAAAFASDDVKAGLLAGIDAWLASSA
jgi:aminodeoxyfutalosine deaminase